MTEPRPELLHKVDGCTDRVTAVIILTTEDGFITVSEDKSVRVWLMRDIGTYWPSICHFLPSPCLCADYHEETRRLLVGLSTGAVRYGR